MINKLRYLLLFILIFGFYASVRAFDNYSEYEEEDSDGLYFFESSNNAMYNGFTYPDGTALMQLLHYNEAFDNLYKDDLKISKLVLLFSCISIIISALGLFGLAAFVAEQR